MLTGAPPYTGFHAVEATSGRNGKGQDFKNVKSSNAWDVVMTTDSGNDWYREDKMRYRDTMDRATRFTHHFAQLSERTSAGLIRRKARVLPGPFADFRSTDYVSTLHQPRLLTYRRILGVRH